MPWPVYVRTTEQPLERAIGSLETDEVSGLEVLAMNMPPIHSFPEVAEEETGLAELDGLVKTLPRGTNKLFRILVDTANSIRLIQITVEA